MRTRSIRARAWQLVAAITAVPLVLAACGSDDGSGTTGAGEPVEVSFLTHWGPDQVSMLEEAAATFEADHPDIQIEVRAVPFANLLSTLRTQGSSPSGPTIASVYDLWLPELVRDGLAVDAPEDVARAVEEAWPQNLVDGVTKDGAVRGFPNEVNLYALNYNQALFDEAGVDGPPTTWTELTETAAQISELGDDTQGLGVITSWPAGTVHPWLSMVASNGGSILDGTTPTLTTPEVTAVTELYASLVESGATVPTMSNANANTTGPYLDNFVNGKTGMIVMANWWKSSLQEAMGERFEKVGVAPIPVGPDGDGASGVSYSWLTIVNGNADDARQQAAWEFLSWLNGADSGENGSSAMGDILMSMGILPSRTSDLEAHADDLSEPFLASYVEMLPDASPFPTVIGGEEMTAAIQQQLEQVIFGSADPGSAMSNAQSEAESILSADG